MTILIVSNDKERLRLGCKKKLVVLRWTNSKLDGVMVKYFWFQIGAIIYRQEPLFLCLMLVSVTILHEKKSWTPPLIFIIFGLKCMIIDNKVCLLITKPYYCSCLWFSLEAVRKVTEWQTVKSKRCRKQDMTKQLTSAAKRKDGEEDWSFGDETGAGKLTMLIKM